MFKLLISFFLFLIIITPVFGVMSSNSDYTMYSYIGFNGNIENNTEISLMYGQGQIFIGNFTNGEYGYEAGIYHITSHAYTLTSSTTTTTLIDNSTITVDFTPSIERFTNASTFLNITNVQVICYKAYKTICINLTSLVWFIQGE